LIDFLDDEKAMVDAERVRKVWREELLPAVEEALGLCVEYEGVKRTKDMVSSRPSKED
jgi:hypothetical protein